MAMLRQPRSKTEDSSEEEFLVRNYEKNVQPSAIQILIQIPGVTAVKIQQWLHLARLVSPVEEIHGQICEYIGNSQCHSWGLKILNIIRFARVNQQQLGQNQGHLKRHQRMLLWHGTKVPSVPFILEHGFKPPAATGQMFGSGIYFADRASKSSRYCLDTLNRNPNPGEIGYMFLCEVLLGKVYNARKPHNEYTTAPPYTDSRGNVRPCDSVKCTGKNIPDRRGRKKVRGNLVIPCGKTVPNTRFDNYTVQFNEFIVYSSDRCQPDYLVKFEFTKTPVQY